MRLYCAFCSNIILELKLKSFCYYISPHFQQLIAISSIFIENTLQPMKNTYYFLSLTAQDNTIKALLSYPARTENKMAKLNLF